MDGPVVATPSFWNAAGTWVMLTGSAFLGVVAFIWCLMSRVHDTSSRVEKLEKRVDCLDEKHRELRDVLVTKDDLERAKDGLVGEFTRGFPMIQALLTGRSQQ